MAFKNPLKIIGLFFYLSLILGSLAPFAAAAAEMRNLEVPKSFYSLKDTIVLCVEMTDQKEPTQFILSGIKGPEMNNLKLMDSKMRALTGKDLKDSIRTGYIAEFHFAAVSLGEASIEPILFTFMNASGEKLKLETQRFKFQVVPLYRKYALHLAMLLVLSAIVFLFLKVRKNLLLSRQRKEAAAKAIEFKKTKLLQEVKAKEELKSSGIHLISGEYALYTQSVTQILLQYFKACYPSLAADDSIHGIRKGLKPYLDVENEKKLEQFLGLAEEIQFTGKTPLQFDLDRISILTKEIIAWHRENGE